MARLSGRAASNGHDSMIRRRSMAWGALAALALATPAFADPPLRLAQAEPAAQAPQAKTKPAPKARSSTAKPQRAAQPSFSQTQQQPMRIDPDDIADPLAIRRDRSRSGLEPTLSGGRGGLRGRF
jgi:hypothetical protein